MAAYYKNLGKNLLDVINELYAEHGMVFTSQNSFTFEGAAGMKKMQDIMDDLRRLPPKKIGENQVVAISDYETSEKLELKSGKKSVITLPKSNVLYYDLDENGSNLIVRPSETEPKIKVYITSVDADGDKAKSRAEMWLWDMKKRFN